MRRVWWPFSIFLLRLCSRTSSYPWREISPSAPSAMVLKNILVFTQLLPLTWTINTRFLPCLADENSTAIDCTRRTFDTIHFLQSRRFRPAPTVQSLDLTCTKLRRLGKHTFSIFPNLVTLNLANNCSPDSTRAKDPCKVEIDSSTFKSLVHLELLDLSGNSLSSIPELPGSLKVLRLQYNRISSIIHPLQTPDLTELLLSGNCFHANPCHQSFYVNKSVFQGLPKLKNLTLGFNNLTAIPDGLPPSLEWLDLRENTIPVIQDYAFSHLPNLTDLNLEWNCQRCDHAARTCIPCPNNASLALTSKSFYAENSSLDFLSLRGNSLKTFPEGLFTPLKRLRRLDLSDNFLANAIRNATFFSELRSLTWISLIYNYEPLKTFDQLFLSPHIANISGLQYLLLSGNFFHNVSKESLDVLSKLQNLKTLELRMNFISACDLTAFRRLTSLTSVDLSQNMLNFIPRGQRPYPEMQQHCDYKNSSTSEFSSTSCTGTEYDVQSGGDTLESSLTDLLEEDAADFPPIFHIRNKFCKNQLTFDLSQNNIMSLGNAVFEGIESTVCLDLSFNYMSPTLKHKPFALLKKIASLNLSYNRLDFYYMESFSELKDTLRILDVSKNEFHFKMRGMGHRFGFLKNLIKLEVLNFADNSIGTRIDQRLECPSLKYLCFSGNNLNTMWETDKKYIYFFQNLMSLIYLDISSNMLRTISPVVLCNLPPTIRFLKISKNQLYSFPWLNISALRNLSHLNLAGNHLANLPNQAIEFGDNFSFLDLSDNHLTTIPEEFFKQAKSLRVLCLSHNRIQELSHQSLPAPFKNGSVLKNLTLHANPFKCDCDTTWFTDFLLSTPLHIPYLTTTLVHCQYPESKQGMNILTIDQHSCQDIYGGLAFLLTTFLVSMFTVLPLLKHLYGWDLWYCLQVLWAGHKGYSQLAGGDSPYQYDAFVVFDTGNQEVRDWIYNELTVHLENSGQRRFCLCLEERDWIPGLSCIENLHSSVYNSLKTVFVLSSDGQTVNGVIRQAFFMVQQRLLDDKMDVAILVLLGDMFPKLKYLELRKRLCRKSVLTWPRNPRAQPLFWNTLRMALSSDNLKSYDKNMSESFI